MPGEVEYSQSGNAATPALAKLAGEELPPREATGAPPQALGQNDAGEKADTALVEIAPKAPRIDSSPDRNMTEEKLTTVSSPTPSVSPQQSPPVGSGNWLTRVLRLSRNAPPTGGTLTLRRGQFAPQVEASGYAETPRTGAAQALARASGLTAQSATGPVLTALAAVLGLALLASVYFFYRHQTAVDGTAASGLTLVAADEKVSQLVQAAEQAYAQGKPDEAINFYKEALQLTPNNTLLLARLAWVYRTGGNLDAALQTYTRLIEIDPKNSEARMQRAYIYGERGKWAEYDQELRQIIRLDQNSEQANEALRLLEATTVTRAGNYPQRAGLRRANHGPNLPLAGGQFNVHVPLSQLLMSAPALPPGLAPSSTGGGAEEHESAKALADAHKLRGNRLQDVGLYKEAINEFEKALKLTPDDKDIYYFIASAYKRAGQDAIAHEYYKKCDSGTYASVARSGAKNTEKAAREAARKAQSPQKNSE